MNPVECAFGVSARNFFGFPVHHKCISVDLVKATTITTMKRPIMIKELKTFIGRVSYIKRFVPELASVIIDLTKLLKKGGWVHLGN